MTDEYKKLVRDAWKLLGIERWDSRGFLESIQALVTERNQLSDDNQRLTRELARLR